MFEMAEITRRRERLTVTVTAHRIGVLPQDAGVFFVQANGVFNSSGRRRWNRRYGGVEIANRAQAVAAGSYSELASVPSSRFASVECILAIMLLRSDRRKAQPSHRSTPGARPAATGLHPRSQSCAKPALPAGRKPIRNRQFCQRTRLPSTVKLGPSGWLISSGLRSVRSTSCLSRFPSGGVRSAWAPPSSCSMNLGAVLDSGSPSDRASTASEAEVGRAHPPPDTCHARECAASRCDLEGASGRSICMKRDRATCRGAAAWISSSRTPVDQESRFEPLFDDTSPTGELP